QPSEKRMLNVLTDVLTKSGNRLLSMSADCQQLADWNAGRRKLLDDYAQYQVGMAAEGMPPAETIGQTCATLRAEGDKILSRDHPSIKSRVESALDKVKMNQATFLGVLGEDPTACYAGLLQNLRTEVGTDKTQVVAFAVTIARNRTLFVYRTTSYVNSNTVE